MMKISANLVLIAALRASLFAVPGAASPALTTLYNFTFGNDGAYPYGNLVVGKGGVLYGMATGGAGDCGGEPDCGIIFELKPPSSPRGTWTETVIHSFVSNAMPGISANALAIGKNGEIYGTVATIAPSVNGSVFVLTPPASSGGEWTYTDIYDFQGGNDGSFPNGIVVGSKGELFGTTGEGGPAQAGTVFLLTPSSSPGTWTEKVIYTFKGIPDGVNPTSGVVIGRNGALAGTTHFGGSGPCDGFIGTLTGCGTVFELTPPSMAGGTWIENLLYSLGTTDNTGWYPEVGAVFGAGESIFAISPAGGPTGKGVPFELTPPSSPGSPWTETTLTTFKGPHSPSNISANLLALSNGVLLSVSAGGGASNNGLIFALVPPTSPGDSWSVVHLYSFAGGNNGATPDGGLVIGPNGALYGVTEHGGNSTACLNLGCGTVYELTL